MLNVTAQAANLIAAAAICDFAALLRFELVVTRSTSVHAWSMLHL
jgi:hypothetical protein